MWKLDGVGPIDTRLSTDKLCHLSEKRKTKKLHVTCDMWHLTCVTWHATCDMLEGVNILSKFQLPSSYCLWVMILWRFWGKGWLTDWLNYSVNDEAVSSTAPATPGLLINLKARNLLNVIGHYSLTLGEKKIIHTFFII